MFPDVSSEQALARSDAWADCEGVSNVQRIAYIATAAERADGSGEKLVVGRRQAEAVERNWRAIFVNRAGEDVGARESACVQPSSETSGDSVQPSAHRPEKLRE